MSGIDVSSKTQNLVIGENNEPGIELLSRTQRIIIGADSIEVVSKIQKIVVESTTVEVVSKTQQIVIDSSKGLQGIPGPQGPQGEPGESFGQNLFVQDTTPVFTTPEVGLWIQTGLDPNGEGITFWIEDGAP